MQFLCEQYNVCRLDIYQHNPSNFSATVSTCNEIHTNQHLHMRTRCVFELLMVRDDLWCLSDVHFMHSDVYGPSRFFLLIKCVL